jgi:hypothetical protein
MTQQQIPLLFENDATIVEKQYENVIYFESGIRKRQNQERNAFINEAIQNTAFLLKTHQIK